MLDSKYLKDNPRLYIFLPILHVVWSDSILTPSEIEHIQNLIDKQLWMKEDDRKLVQQYLDPKSPPTQSEMRQWIQEIRKASNKMPVELKSSLIDIGIRLATLNGTVEDEQTLKNAKHSLHEIENALGVVSAESEQRLLGRDQPTQSEKLSTDASFEINEMTDLLDGSDKEIIRKVKTIISDSKLAYYEGSDQSEYREEVLRWCKLLADQGFGSHAYPKKFGGANDMGGYFTIMETLSYHDLSLVVKFGVQFGLFGMSIYFLGTDSHHEKYLKDIGTLDLPGSFAMTETGHGSNVNGIETTATYDHQRGTFIVHTPNELARKDYIGNAACHAQMATVFAKLIINDFDYGVTAFLVPVRDEKAQLLAGIRIEDCGKKMGLNGVDNGRIWFDQVEIPKENMLDKFASINESGEFESPIASDSRRFFTMLGTLVGGRIGIPRAGLSASKSGLAIAIRYSDTRKQFGPEMGKEVSILNYRTHQRRLMPLLANAYALHFSLKYLTKRFLNRTEEDQREIESLAAGLKAFATWNTTTTLQTCREACGGKGYLSENRIGILKNDSEIFTTFEGDNTVLMQLVAKGRLSEFKQEFHDIDFFGMVNYVSAQAKTAMIEMNPITVRNTDEAHLLDSEFHLSAFSYRERDILTSAAKRIKKHLDAGMNSFDAFNQCQYHLFNVGLAYTERIVLEQFINQVNTTTNPDLKSVLKKLCDLFALTQIEKNKGWYLEHDYMSGVKTKAVRRLVNKLCLEIRQDAVPLVDAFQIPASCLAAPIALDAKR